MKQIQIETAISRVLAALRRKKWSYERVTTEQESYQEWKAPCPVHPHRDRRPSLSIRELDYSVVFRCRSCDKCDPDAIREYFGLSKRDCNRHPNELASAAISTEGNYHGAAYATPQERDQARLLGPSKESRKALRAYLKEHPATYSGRMKMIKRMRLDKHPGPQPVLAEWALRQWGVRWVDAGPKWSHWLVPERDHEGRLVAIQVRPLQAGKDKYMVGEKKLGKGLKGKRGLTLPRDMPEDRVDVVYVTEGGSDAMALWMYCRWQEDLLRMSGLSEDEINTSRVVIGRPQAGKDAYADQQVLLFCRKWLTQGGTVIVLGDRDAKGQGEKGARRLAEYLMEELSSLYTVNAAMPPEGCKDMREMLRKGKGLGGLECIETATHTELALAR